MPAKAEIVGVLGENELLLPELVREALDANGRAKYLFALLQLARAHADAPDAAVPNLRRDRELAGIADPQLDGVIDGSHRGRDDEYRIPLAKAIVTHIFAEIDVMMASLRACPARFEEERVAAFERRRSAIWDACSPVRDAAIASDAVARLTSSDRDHADSAHLLVLDLHKAVDEVAASLATDDINGASAYGLTPDDRPLVFAFMKGIHETEAVKLGHPGLGTTTMRSGSRLVLENDVGETKAHVIVVHIEGLRLVVRSTDVHLPRLEFFQRMFDGFHMEWADLRSRSARELANVGLFYECVGTFEAKDREELERFLTHLGSRLVFLIDWNRARKTLRAFVPKDVSIELLDWAAKDGCGHRGLLEMGGDRLVFDAMASVLRTPLRFGERLDDVLGHDGAADFLRFVLRDCSVGLRSGRSRSLIRAEIRAELSRAVRGRGERLLGPVAEHAAIIAEMARGLSDQLRALGSAQAEEREAAARVAKERERRGDEVVVMLRDVALRIPDAEPYRQLLELADDAADALEEAAFLASLLPLDLPPSFHAMPFGELGARMVETTETYAACVTWARSADAEGQHRMLDAVDALITLERRMDETERRVTACLAREAAVDGKLFVLASRISAQVERAVDALTRAALVLRNRLTRSP